MEMLVARAGFLTSVQDLGRTGCRQFGVSLGGALDAFALRVANLLVGNEESAAGLEITLGGLQLRFADDRIVGWCGGEFDVRVGSTSLPAGHVTGMSAGEELKFNHPKIGCRCWVALCVMAMLFGLACDRGHPPSLKLRRTSKRRLQGSPPGARLNLGHRRRAL